MGETHEGVVCLDKAKKMSILIPFDVNDNATGRRFMAKALKAASKDYFAKVIKYDGTWDHMTNVVVVRLEEDKK